MDASQYLRRKTEACTQYVSRSQCVSAGDRTHMLGLMASQTYSNTIRGVPLACQTASAGAKSTENVAVKTPCGAALCATFFENRYGPGVEIPGCPYPRDAVQPAEPLCAGTPCYQGTPEEYRGAVQARVNRELGRDCACDEKTD
jgi:hypothetical protein